MPFRIAIAGSGPSGCFVAEELLKVHLTAEIDIYDKLPVPYGLVRSGVAPDHQQIKSVIKKFEKIFLADNVKFWGNVSIGTDISISELQNFYDIIVLCHGAEKDRKLDLPGSEYPGCYSATEFVGWYNGHPDYRHHQFNFQTNTAVIIGQGNVAVDVARILAKHPGELATTDIAEHALEALRQSEITDIYLVGRRGPAQAAFTDKELRELTNIPHCNVLMNPNDLALSESCKAELDAHPNAKAARNFQILDQLAHVSELDHGKRIHLSFFASPVECIGPKQLTKVRFVRNQLVGSPGNQKAIPTEDYFSIESALLFFSIGYRGEGLPGLPFDAHQGIYPHQAGRVMTGESVLAGVYTSGWIKRGPTGVVGTNKADALETVRSILEDSQSLARRVLGDKQAIRGILTARGVRVVSYADWQTINQHELAQGTIAGKIRKKLISREEIFDLLDG